MARRDKLFKQNKARLKRLYKLFKAGLISESDISDEDKELLAKYYDIKTSAPAENVPEDNDQSESGL